MSKRRNRRTWSDDEKREICQQSMAPGISVAQVARRYALNANMIHTWLKDERFAPPDEDDTDTSTEAPFLEVTLAAPTSSDLPVALAASEASSVDPLSANRVDISLSDGRRILIEGPTTLASVVGLVDGLMGASIFDHSRGCAAVRLA